MTTTPVLWKTSSQVNTADAAVAAGGSNAQYNPQIAALDDGGYVVVWTDYSLAHSSAGTAIIGQRYDAAGYKVGGEINIANGPSTGGDSLDAQLEPSITLLQD